MRPVDLDGTRPVTVTLEPVGQGGKANVCRPILRWRVDARTTGGSSLAIRFENERYGEAPRLIGQQSERPRIVGPLIDVALSECVLKLPVRASNEIGK